MGKLTSYAKLGTEIIKRGIKPEMTRANISITSKCNQRCLTCNIWQGDNKAIPVDDYFKVIKNNNLMWVTLTGGEPTLHPFLDQIVSETLKKTPLVQINTNGVLRGQLVNALIHALGVTSSGIVIVSVSLFGDSHHHEMITRTRGSYDRAIETIKHLKSINNNRLIVGIAHTICKYNTNQVPHIERLAKELGVGVSYAIERYSGYYNNLNSVNGFHPVMPNLKFSLNPLDIFKNVFIKHGDHKAGCVAGEYSCWVMPNLNVYPCISSIPDRPAFNLFGSDYNLDRFTSQQRKNISKCVGCWTACESYQTLIFRPWRAL